MCKVGQITTNLSMTDQLAINNRKGQEVLTNTKERDVLGVFSEVPT